MFFAEKTCWLALTGASTKPAPVNNDPQLNFRNTPCSYVQSPRRSSRKYLALVGRDLRTSFSWWGIPGLLRSHNGTIPSTRVCSIALEIRVRNLRGLLLRLRIQVPRSYSNSPSQRHPAVPHFRHCRQNPHLPEFRLNLHCRLVRESSRIHYLRVRRCRASRH